MDTLIDQMANVGFPMVVSAYLLVRVESKLNSLTESINALSNTLVNLK